MTVLIAMFIVMPPALALSAPANVEYGYEPIPGVAGSSSVNSRFLVSQSDNGPGFRAGSESASDGANFFGIIGESWILAALLVAIALALAVLTWRRYRANGRDSGMVPRVVALAAVLVTLPLITLSSAESATRSVAPKGFFGMITQTSFTGTDATRMAIGGVETLRIPMAWSQVQPDNTDQFDWSGVDTTVGQAAKSGITVLPFLYNAPDWATGRNTNLPVRNATQKNAWTKFVGAAEERYGPGGDFWQEHTADSIEPIDPLPVRTWQIGNEANFFFFATPVSSSDYLTELKLASTTIKQSDPRAKIMLSGLYGSPPKHQVKAGKAVVSYKFLNQLYKKGAAKYFDIAAIHPYTPNTSQTKVLMDKFRSVMDRNGDKKTPISISEVGWGSGRKGFLNVGSPGKQANQVKSAFKYFLANRHKLRLLSVYWFSWQDKKNSETSCNFCYTTGMFKSSAKLTPKPAWKAFVKFSGGKP